MMKGTNKKSDMKTFSGPKEFALAFAAFVIPGMRGRLEKYDQMDAKISAELAAHEAKAAPIRERADAIIAAHAKKKSPEASSASPTPLS